LSTSGVSCRRLKNSIASYSLAFEYFVAFAAKRLKTRPIRLTVEQLTFPLILDFLDGLEKERHNSVRTRNLRLVAIKSFFRYLEFRAPACLELAQGSTRFQRSGLTGVWSNPSPLRKYRPSSTRLTPERRTVYEIVRCHHRAHAPIRPESSGITRHSQAVDIVAPISCARDSRHSCALHTLDAVDNDLRKVSMYLGHASLKSTEPYVRGDLIERLRALAARVPPQLRKGNFKSPSDPLLALLGSGSRASTRPFPPAVSMVCIRAPPLPRPGSSGAIRFSTAGRLLCELSIRFPQRATSYGSPKAAEGLVRWRQPQTARTPRSRRQ